MRAAIIGASEESLHTIKKAKELGIEVVALDGNPSAAGLPVADIPLVVNIADEKATVDAVKDMNIDFTLTVPIGRYLTTTGYVNDILNLPGISSEAANKCTDKYLFHSILNKAFLRNCNCYLLKGHADNSNLRDRISESTLNFPAILKPRFGSGSRGIYVVNNKGDIYDVLPKISGEEYVLEECIPGEEYGFDGAVTDGKMHLVLLRKKDNTPLPDRQAVCYYSVNPLSDVYNRISAYINKVVEKLELNECLIHGDIIDSAKGPFAIEVSARPSGHNLHNLFTPLCTGVDMAEEYIRHRLGLTAPFIPANTRSMMIHYFDLTGRVIQVPAESSVAEICAVTGCKLIEWECNIKDGELLKPVHNGHELMCRGYYITQFDSFDDMEDKKKQLISSIQAAFF